jgi:hypothetical protein
MAWLGTFLARACALWRAERIHQDIDEELRIHLEMRAEENVRRGMQPEEARREAERCFGQFTRIRELGYDVRGAGWLEALWQDLCFGVRMHLRKPAFTLGAVFTLAIGIAASTAILSIVNSVILRPLVFPDPDRLRKAGLSPRPLRTASIHSTLPVAAHPNELSACAHHMNF